MKENNNNNNSIFINKSYFLIRKETVFQNYEFTLERGYTRWCVDTVMGEEDKTKKQTNNLIFLIQKCFGL